MPRAPHPEVRSERAAGLETDDEVLTPGLYGRDRVALELLGGGRESLQRRVEASHLGARQDPS